MAVITVRNLEKRFGRKQVLDHIDFVVEEGQIFGYLGPNGAGKTTTLLLLLGLLTPTHGEALVMDDYMDRRADIRANVGVVLEKHGLYETFTGFDNLCYYARLYGVDGYAEKSNTMLKQVGLLDVKDTRVHTYSTGMKKRLALARALIHSPSVLFLDEPTTGLDPEAQIDFRDTMVRLSRETGTTVFLNSHNLDEVQKVCTHIAILDRGSIRVWDSVEEVRKRFSEPTVELIVETEEDIPKATHILETSAEIVSLQRHERKFICEISQDRFPLRELVTAGIEVEAFRKSIKTLEEVYMDIIRKTEGEEG